MSANNGSISNADDLQAALQQLYTLLSGAYWDATTVEAKDMIAGCMQGIYDVLTEFNQVDFATRTPAFDQLASDIAPVNQKLVQLKNNIDNLIHRINTATEVATAIDKVLNLAGLVFA